MSRALNKVMLIGNVGVDPIYKKTQSGAPVASFRMATSESWKSRDGNIRENTEWHTVVAWRGLAEVVNKIVTKGSRVYIEGKLQCKKFEDSNGVKKEVVEIVAEQLIMLEQKKSKEEREKDSYSEEYSSDGESSSESGESSEEKEDDESYEYNENNYNTNAERNYDSEDYDSEFGDGYSPKKQDSYTPF